ncbi:MAG: KOW motif-containing protein [Muribaculaceae bacterium]|nr:KOW motif-containing protein [Muribaculaceae bacterium]
MKPQPSGHAPSRWFAIKTRQDFRAEEILTPYVDEIFFPKEILRLPGHRPRQRAIIPRVLFLRTNPARILELEREAREHPEIIPSFWIYRYPTDNTIQTIPDESIRLLRLLTADDTTRCQIYRRRNFTANQRVRVTGGPFAGYEGVVQRVKKNRHVIIRIEGICAVMLPFIHPDLLEPLEPETKGATTGGGTEES